MTGAARVRGGVWPWHLRTDGRAHTRVQACSIHLLARAEALLMAQG